MAWYDNFGKWTSGGASSGSSTGGGSGNLSGSVYDYSSSYGGKANVPDPTTSSATAISGNVSNLGSLYNLANSQNQFSTQQAVQEQNQLTPGYSGNMAKWSADISNLLSGKLSSGTITTMEQAAAEQGVSTGLSGSQANESSLLRALGLTSEGLQATGASQLASQIASSPKVSSFDMTPYLTTAADQQSAQYAANTIASAAVPSSAAAAGVNSVNSGLATGLNSAGTSTAGGGTNSSLSSLLSSILGTGTGSSGAGTGSILGTNSTGNSGIASALNSILGTNGTTDLSGETNATLGTAGDLYSNGGGMDVSGYTGS